MSPAKPLPPLLRAIASLTNGNDAYWATMAGVYPEGFSLLGDAIMARNGTRHIQFLRTDAVREALEVLVDGGCLPPEWGSDGRPRWRRESWFMGNADRPMCPHYLYREHCSDCNEAEAPFSLSVLLSVAALGLERIRRTETLALESAALTDLPADVTVGWCTRGYAHRRDKNAPVWASLRKGGGNTLWVGDTVQRTDRVAVRSPLADAQEWGVEPWEAVVYRDFAALYVLVPEVI